MLNTILTSGTAAVSIGAFLICILSALILGAGMAVVYRLCGETSRSFSITLALLPAIVCVVILMVSGSIGAGVAVAGTFSLIRFRSAPGTAREIGAVFAAMAVGLACGMGYPHLAVIVTILIGGAYIFYTKIGFGENKSAPLQRTLRITVPEDLEYAGMFDDILEEYTTGAVLTQVKTTNLGSLNRLSYDLTLKASGTEKALIDALRCRNGNLEITLAARMNAPSEL